MLAKTQSLSFNPGLATEQGNELAKQANRVLCMLPRYGVYNEVGMSELRKAICAWLDIEITDEQAFDARGWEAFIAPHESRLG